MYDLPGAYIRDLVELVGRWKVAPDELLADLPITAASLGDPATRVPLRVCEAIVARAHALTHEPALAFYLGMQMRVSSHGFLGFAAMTAGTVREALELATRFASTRTSAIALALYVEGDTASLVIEERTPLGALRELVVIAILVGIWQLGQALTGRPLDGNADCAFPEPAYAKSLAHAGRLRFDRPAHRLVFPAIELELPLSSADPVAARLAIEQCERELSAVVDAGLASRIRGMLAARVELPSVGELARELHMSERTLKRKLADLGTTYSAIRDDLRRQRALLLLENRELSIGEIAGKVGYSELPNFTRAFRKWTGMTPAAYRERGRR
ncbi:MAG: AraC family transcriptional regulator ligand-binding domain-containing protein [Kofleriaceae bacterium]|nr:AraC family transcriptional regulator ligand-binding domain-containing protein [Kofleriaceae bacterium]